MNSIAIGTATTVNGTMNTTGTATITTGTVIMTGTATMVIISVITTMIVVPANRGKVVFETGWNREFQPVFLCKKGSELFTLWAA
ncbi:MAG TPA: hypothetical protein VK738_04765 [Terriglobales bacterium]|nr:hypothetical protein [Terriglobales bacterium]